MCLRTSFAAVAARACKREPLRRNIDGSPLVGATAMPGNISLSSAQRGFTGHEMLDEVGLVHMNGRVYDPMIGRFLQADPIIQEPYLSQSYNRYSYVINNPLSLTDPSGFSWWVKWRRPIMALVAALVVPHAVEFLITELALAGSMGAANLLNTFAYLNAGAGVAITNASAIGIVAGGMAGGAISGGNFESAIIGGFKAAASFGIGNMFDAHGAAPVGMLNKIGHTAAHATVGCATAAMAGGSCKAGAMAQGFSALAGNVPEIAAAGLPGRMVVGAVASKLGGGDYASGALAAAFEYLYNHGGGSPFGDYHPAQVYGRGVQANIDYGLPAYSAHPHHNEQLLRTKTPEPPDAARVYETRAVRIKEGQAIAHVGKDTYYRYSIDPKAGTAHFSATMTGSDVNNRFGNNSANQAQAHGAVRALQINAQQLQNFRNMTPAQQAAFMAAHPLPTMRGR
jgi:RHS repeat-associated protein